MIPKTPQDAIVAMKACASAQGDRFDLTAFAIAAALHENSERDTAVAFKTLEQITSLAQKYRPSDAQGFAALMYGELGFTGGRGDYDDPANANILDILTTRSGLPIGLGHIWRHAARVIQAPLHGTDTPGHFIMRLETQGEPAFLDPFEGGAVLDQDGLDAIAQRASLQSLSARMLSPVSDRVMAVRLQTNLLARAKARGDIEGWFKAAFRRLLLASSNYQIAIEYAEAAEAAGHIKSALEWSLKANNMADAPQGQSGHAHSAHIQTLSRKLN
jgi:regulator of sirC expression with transglutaminase-like and TPR domain